MIFRENQDKKTLKHSHFLLGRDLRVILKHDLPTDIVFEIVARYSLRGHVLNSGAKTNFKFENRVSFYIF